MGERKKPSSLRGRVDRARKGYSKPMNPVPIIIGVVVVAVCGVGLYLAFKGGPASDAGEGGTGETPVVQPAASAAAGSVSRPPAPLPKDPKKAVYALTMRAKRDAKTAPDAAMRELEQALGKYQDYAPDIYFAMAMVVEAKIQKGGGNSAPRHLFGEKLKFLRRAKEAIDAGKEWVYDPIGNRTGNIEMSITQAEKEANK